MPPDSNELLAGSFRTPTDRVTVSQMLIEADGKRNADRLRNDAWGFHMADKRGLDFQHPTREYCVPRPHPAITEPSSDMTMGVHRLNHCSALVPCVLMKAFRSTVPGVPWVQINGAGLKLKNGLPLNPAMTLPSRDNAYGLIEKHLRREAREIFQLGRINTPAPSVTGRLLIYEQAASNDLTIAAGGKSSLTFSPFSVVITLGTPLRQTTPIREPVSSSSHPTIVDPSPEI